MNKMQKILLALTPREQEAFILLFQQIESDYRKVPGIKPLRGMKDIFRVRMGSYRIIFRVNAAGRAEIIRLARRDEKTYKGL